MGGSRVLLLATVIVCILLQRAETTGVASPVAIHARMRADALRGGCADGDSAVPSKDFSWEETVTVRVAQEGFAVLLKLRDVASVAREVGRVRAGLATFEILTPGIAFRAEASTDGQAEGNSASVQEVAVEGGLFLGDDLPCVITGDWGDVASFHGHKVDLRVKIHGARSERNLSAQHVIGGDREGDLDSAKRAVEIDAALDRLGIPLDTLLADPRFDGSSARRAYRSFVFPRQGRVPPASRLHPIEVQASRAAQQVAMLWRAHLTELDARVRSSDRARASAEEGAGSAPKLPLSLVLDNLRSCYNVGSVFRTAETAGLREVVTCGITPHPPDNMKLRKTAFTAADIVPTRHFDSTLAAVHALQREGVRVFAMETAEGAACYSAVAFPRGCALVLGNEVSGVSPDVIAACDGLIEIPTAGVKNSLNVASACAVAAFEVVRQWRAEGGRCGACGRGAADQAG